MLRIHSFSYNSTRIFNNQSEPIGRELVTSAFNGKVCIKMMGFQENLQTNEISLLAHVHQMKVEKAEEEEVFKSGCLFEQTCVIIYLYLIAYLIHCTPSNLVFFL